MIIGQTRTPPLIGVPRAHRYVVASCSNLTMSTGFKVIDAIAALNPKPDFIPHLGDLSYDDNRMGAGTDALYQAELDAGPMKQKRSLRYWLRYFRKFPKVAELLRTTAFYWNKDDHDLYNDAHWDTVFATKTYDQINQALNQAYMEQTPHPTLWDAQGRVIGFEWNWGAIRYLMTDTRSQRRYTTGTPTLFGHNSGHEHVDHFTKICDRITQAGIDGVVKLVIFVTCTWAGNAHDGFGFAGAEAERAALCNHMKAVQALYGTRMVLISADGHLCAADDGTNSDYSTGGIGMFAHFVSSPWQSTSLSAGTYGWLGVDSKHATSDTMLGVFDANAANDNVTATFIDCAAGGAGVVVGTYNTEDLWAA
jgi:phosphodiesterase/alkaline phosphatase D-like protein